MDIKKLPKTEFAQAVAQIAGERNIDPQLILDSIDAGLISAYKRDQKEHGVIVPEEDQFTVELSPTSGSFKVFKIEGDKQTDVTPPGFGRIAAQTAKQVIDQKIHEAEKNVLIAEFQKNITILYCSSFRSTNNQVLVQKLFVPKTDKQRREFLLLKLLLKNIKEETGLAVLFFLSDNDHQRTFTKVPVESRSVVSKNAHSGEEQGAVIHQRSVVRRGSRINQF